VRSDVGGSGVMFSIDTETGFDKVVLINAAWGLGENVVQGTVDPDEHRVFKPLLGESDCRPIVERKLGRKERKLVFGRRGAATDLRRTGARDQRAFVLTDDEVLELARAAVAIERHYGKPMDMEWAKDGPTGELFMVQARPETVQALRSGTRFTVHHLHGRGKILATGAAVGDAVAAGEACVVRDPTQIETFRDGAILVTEMTDPDWVPLMKRAAGIITDHGGPTSHAAIVSRELGIPCVVSAGDCTTVIPNGALVEVNGTTGTVTVVE